LLPARAGIVELWAIFVAAVLNIVLQIEAGEGKHEAGREKWRGWQEGTANDGMQDNACFGLAVRDQAVYSTVKPLLTHTSHNAYWGITLTFSDPPTWFAGKSGP
jgi:hypothetical protein